MKHRVSAAVHFAALLHGDRQMSIIIIRRGKKSGVINTVFGSFSILLVLIKIRVNGEKASEADSPGGSERDRE